jgi:hypothetical protein
MLFFLSPKKIFHNATVKLPLTKKYTIKYFFYKTIELFFIILNNFFPVYRLKVKDIKQIDLSLLPINDYYYISDSFFYNNKKK